MGKGKLEHETFEEPNLRELSLALTLFTAKHVNAEIEASTYTVYTVNREGHQYNGQQVHAYIMWYREEQKKVNKP